MECVLAVDVEAKKAALSALKLYEETASAEREARMSILPVGFYPCPLNQEPPSSFTLHFLP